MSDTDQFEMKWVDPPAAQAGRPPGPPSEKYIKFFGTLIEHPDKWALLPDGPFSRRVSTDIRNGKSPVPKKYRDLQFNAVSRGGFGLPANRAEIYVSYRPADAPQDSAEQAPEDDEPVF